MASSTIWSNLRPTLHTFCKGPWLLKIKTPTHRTHGSSNDQRLSKDQAIRANSEFPWMSQQFWTLKPYHAFHCPKFGPMSYHKAKFGPKSYHKFGPESEWHKFAMCSMHAMLGGFIFLNSHTEGTSLAVSHAAAVACKCAQDAVLASLFRDRDCDRYHCHNVHVLSSDQK
jgi:hypothetical protein